MQRRSSGELVIYTIGYGGRSRAKFLELLNRYKIDILVDVRRWPNSKVVDFKQHLMEEWLKDASIKYVWLGSKLGGFRKGGYEKYMAEAEFREGVKELLEAATQNRVCLMCLEVSPKGCHRRYIAKYLNKLGVRVRHIISGEKVVDEAQLT